MGSEESEKTDIFIDGTSESFDEETAALKTNTKKHGGQPENKNAVGNRGGPGGPLRNKHAVKTHEYETIFWTADIIDEDERRLLNADYDKYVRLLVLIDTLTVREQRILRRIASLRGTSGGMVLDTATKGKTVTTTQYTRWNDEGETEPGSSNTVTEETSSHVAMPMLTEITKQEEALTRVQGRLQRALEAWHKMELDDEKLHIDKVKLQLLKQRITGQIDLDELVDGDDLGMEFDGESE